MISSLTPNRFTCPMCGKDFPVEEAQIDAVLVEEKSDLSFQGNRYVDKITERFYKVRFCKDCRKKRMKQKIARHVSYLLLSPFVLLIIMCIIEQKLMFSWGAYFIGMLFGFGFYVPVVKFYREEIVPNLNKKLLKRAEEGNAIIYGR